MKTSFKIMKSRAYFKIKNIIKNFKFSTTILKKL